MMKKVKCNQSDLVTFLEICDMDGVKKMLLPSYNKLWKSRQLFLMGGGTLLGKDTQSCVKTSEPLSTARLGATHPSILSKYCDLLEHTLNKNKLMNRPTHIYNLDGSGMPLDAKPTRVVTSCGHKHPSTVVMRDKRQIIVLACCSASGHCMPPFVVLRNESNTRVIEGKNPWYHLWIFSK